MILKLKYILKAAFLSQLLFSCTERSLEPRPEPEPVPIRLFTGIRTRATVDVFGDTPVCVAYGVRTGQYDGSWDGIATDNEIRLMPERYYPSDGSALYLRGYYPPAPLTADGRLTYRLTGEEDLMLTGEQNGSLSAPFGESDSQSLLYRHLLTQLIFTLTVEAEDTGALRVRSLHLNGLTDEVTLSLAEESLLPGERTVSVPVDLVLSVDDDRTHDREYRALPVRFEGGEGEGGTAYTVRVELPDPVIPDPVEIVAVATVGRWQEGDSGSGELVDNRSAETEQ